jgi:hypothetical protein
MHLCHVNLMLRAMPGSVREIDHQPAGFSGKPGELQAAPCLFPARMRKVQGPGFKVLRGRERVRTASL